MSSHISTSHFVSAFAAHSSILRMRNSHQQLLEWTSKLFRKRGAEIAWMSILVFAAGNVAYEKYCYKQQMLTKNVM